MPASKDALHTKLQQILPKSFTKSHLDTLRRTEYEKKQSHRVFPHENIDIQLTSDAASRAKPRRNPCR